VKACNPRGCGAWTSSDTATPQPSPPPPPPSATIQKGRAVAVDGCPSTAVCARVNVAYSNFEAGDYRITTEVSTGTLTNSVYSLGTGGTIEITNTLGSRPADEQIRVRLTRVRDGAVFYSNTISGAQWNSM